jgi:hypothetical protein
MTGIIAAAVHVTACMYICTMCLTELRRMQRQDGSQGCLQQLYYACDGQQVALRPALPANSGFCIHSAPAALRLPHPTNERVRCH